MSDEKEYTTHNKKYQLNIPQMLSGGMSENWLLKELGDVHWNMISEALDSRSDQIIDSNGERLYASFVRLQWSMKSNCLAGFNENEEVWLKGDLSLYGNKIFFSTDTLSGENKEIFTSLMSVFSSRKSGNNQQLTKGKPLNVKEAKVYKHDQLPEFAIDFFKLKTILFPTTTNNEENDQQQFHVLESQFSLEQDCGFSKSYTIDPYDDINGVGLLYFASYPKISDKCERFYFQDNYQRIDKKVFNWAEISSCIARDIHYYGNANVNDELLYVLELYTIIKESNTIKTVSSLYRKKDKKLIAKVFTLKKIVFPIAKKPIDQFTEEQESFRSINDKNAKPRKIQQSKLSLDILLIDFFSKMFPGQKFSINTDLRPLGIESITFLELSEYLNVNHGLSVNPSDFYGLYTIDQISNHFSKPVELTEPLPVSSKEHLNTSKKKNELKDSKDQKEEQDDIAIIGLAFKLPGGIETKEAFWDLLKEGKHIIQDLPKNRWKWPEKIQVDGEHKGINMGGFLEDVLSFDADFFKVSPREAEIMDPQQRKLLEVCWHCLEDSGITTDQLKGSNTGVFVGASGSDYSRYIGDHHTIAHAGIGISTSVLANRISHFFDLKGPSMQLDTACSSSLVALHQAINAIKNKECDQAIVSGVNMMLHPFNTQVYYKAGMLNKEGVCKTFDKDAGGYVRGEGVITLMIKPLSKAHKDGDIPYAIIKGSAINHGGYAGGITVPNPNQQSALIEKALSDAKVTAKEVSFIEAHGTGTKLGDPIEINGLNKVFRKINTQKNNCLIGSVKTNIGHLEAAAGLAGLVKVLVSFENEKIPPIANFKELNPHIDLSNSSIRINQDLKKWEISDMGNRIAGISSFGSGGTNAHVIVEHIPIISQPKIMDSDHYLICISGNTNEALKRNIQQLLKWLDTQDQIDLLSVSSNLLLRRTHLLHRVAFVVNTIEDLKNVLSNKSIRSESEKEYYSTDYKQTNSQPQFVEWFEDYLKKIKKYSDIEKLQLQGLAELFVRGSYITWKNLFKTLKPNRESLPFYQFEKNFFSIISDPDTSKSDKPESTFIHRNESQYNLQRFVSNFSGEEYFFREHQLKDTPILPGVAYLEMIRYALHKSFPDISGTIKISEIYWKAPIIGNNSQEIHTELTISENKAITYSITNQSENQENCSGEISIIENSIINKRDIKTLKSQCTVEIGSETIYNILKKSGYHYGNTFRTITDLYSAKDMALGILTSSKLKKYPLEELAIGVLDGALQAAMYTFFLSKEDSQIVYPFFVESFSINTQLLDLDQNIYVYTYKERDQIQVELLDEQGNVVYKFDNVIFKPQQDSINSSVKLYTPQRSLLKKSIVQEPIKNSIIIGYGGKEFLQHLNSLPTTVADLKTQIITLNKEQHIDEFNRVIKSLLVLLKQLIDNYNEEALTLFFFLEKEKGINYSNGINGVLNCLSKEYDNISYQLVEVENIDGTYSEMIEAITNNFNTSEKRIIWDKGTRYGLTWNEMNHNPQLPWKDKGVYVITGGSGAIGKHFAKAIASKVASPTIILLGRSPYNEINKKQITDLKQSGAYAEYRSLDICDYEQLSELRNYVLSQFGQIDGIIHTAGVKLDELLIQVSEDSLDMVLDPKVKGTQNLDAVFVEEKMDFMLLFSSIIPVIGNIGQTSYAAANGFIDDFSKYRNQLVNKKKRYGKTIAINWPYWIDGGMKMPLHIQDEIKNTYGLVPLTTDHAIESIDRMLSGQEDQVMAVLGDHNKMLSVINGVATSSLQPEEEKGSIITAIKKIIGNVIKKSPDQLSETIQFDQMGIDSIIQMDLLKELGKIFGKLSKTLLFEYANIKELSDYLITSGKKIKPQFDKEVNPRNVDYFSSIKKPLFIKKQNVSQLEIASDDIAIIGFSGRFPKSDSIQEFWENLKKAKDCISTIPDFRKIPTNKKYYGGFLNHIDKFDASLFGIEDKDVAQLTPEERLFLEIAWETFQDAGYNEERLKDIQDTENQGIGVYVGAMYDQYGSLSQSKLGQLATNWTNWQIANRTSHFFDLTGPSLLINTACSSSFSAIHTACESLLCGNSSIALVGAVNLTLDHTKFLALEKASFLERGTTSRSFGEGTGYLPGEGVGAVLLKPLSKAINDHDRIDGVIKNSSVNHSGGRLKYTTPDPRIQARLIEKSLQKARVNKADIGYIECAANGSELGDPIEITALKSVFNKEQLSKQIILGAVKANIGHLEAASGISQLIKVLLQFRYNALVPSINSHPLNKAISLKETPFKIQKIVEEWPENLPKLSMINSFGAGGSYANIIIDRGEQYNRLVKSQNVNLDYFIFSANSKNSLQNYLKKIRAYLPDKKDDLISLSATLIKTSRDLPYRVGIQAESKTILERKITWFLRQFDSFGEDAIYYSKSLKIKSINDQDHLLVRWVKDGFISSELKNTATSIFPVSLPKYAFEHQDFHPINLKKEEFKEDNWDSIYQTIISGELKEEKFKLLLNQ